MRKQMKIAAVVSAAALLALGASITSFAAQKGTWKYEDGEWYCYDKNGDVYENTFCLSNGKEFYVGDDGTLVTSSWVEDDGDYYFVNSAGQKIINDWRLATPYDDDSADEEWFYFQSSGKRAENKKLLIKGKTYFFDSDGYMITGWVQGSDGNWDEGSTDDVKNTDTYYCDETGARLEKAWVKAYAPSVDEDDVDSDEDEFWYYLKSSGKVATGKQSNIKNQTYFFDNQGRMLTGWVVATKDDADKTYYDKIWNDDDSTDGTYGSALDATMGDVYFCGDDEDDGHMKKNKWLKAYNNVQFGEDDDDNDKYWFWIEKSGKIYVPSNPDATATRYKLEDGEGESFGTRFTGSYYDNDSSDSLTVTEKKINSKTYYFNAHGEMLTKFVRIENNVANNSSLREGAMYYLGGSDDGVRKDGSITTTDESGESYRFFFATENKPSQGYWNAAGVNGAKNGKLYEDGILVKATDNKYETKTVTVSYVKTVNGVDEEISEELTFIVNKSGSIQTSKKVYEEDDDKLVDASDAEFEDAKGAMYKSVTGLK